MLHVLLLILKIIGLILAALLLLVLFLVLLLLFVPIRYKAFVSKREKLLAEAKVSWLLHLVSVPVSFRDGVLSVKVKIFGITVKDLTENQEELSKEAESLFQDTEEAAGQAGTDLLKHEGEAVGQNAEEKEEKPEKKEEPEKAGEDIEPVTAEPKPREAEGASGPPENKLLSGLLAVREKIRSIFEKIRNLKYTFRRFCVKIKRMIKKLRDTKEFLTDERTKAAIRLCLSQVKVLLLRLLPKKVRGEIHFGMSDPALTGEILGGISIFYPVFMDNVKVLPDFEESCLEGELYVKGRFRLATAALIAIKLLKNKNVRYVYRKLSR